MEEATVAKKVVKKKEYKTRAVRGQVIDAATSAPIPGAMIKAYGVDGYSGLTDDQGNYTINVPVFTSSLYVSEPDYNAVVLGLTKEEQQKTVMLHKNRKKKQHRIHQMITRNLLISYRQPKLIISNILML